MNQRCCTWTRDTLHPLQFDLLHQQNHVLLLFFCPHPQIAVQMYAFFSKMPFFKHVPKCSWGECNSYIYEIDSYLCQAGLQFSPTALVGLCNKQNN